MIHQRFVKKAAYKNIKYLIFPPSIPVTMEKTQKPWLYLSFIHFVQSLIYSVFPDGQLLVDQLSLVRG